MSLANDSQTSIWLEVPNVTRCKPVLAINGAKLSSSLLSIVVVANRNVASTQPHLSTWIRLVSCPVTTYSINQFQHPVIIQVKSDRQHK